MKVPFVFLTFLRHGLGQDTPVEKVISLLTDLQTQVTNEGTQEASEYDNFACFCKSTTTAKSSAITSGRDNINSLAALIGEDTAAKASKTAELQQRTKDDSDMKTELSDTQRQHAEATEQYNIKKEDLTKAISSLQNAINSMEGSKPTSFLAVRQSVEQGLVLAGIMRLVDDSKKKEIDAFLQTGVQVDPTDPTYKYHSQSIIDTLTKLLGEFQAESNEHESEWVKTDKVFTDTIADLTEKIRLNGDAMSSLSIDIDGLTANIANSRAQLVGAEASLKDDQLYLKDLTTLCETRANDWDQRSHMRAQELAALSQALSVLTNDVQARDATANQRALIQNSIAGSRQALVGISRHADIVSFFQDSESKGHAVGESSMQSHSEHAVQYLVAEGQRLHSAVLSNLAAQVRDDPFDKVKTLIQKLIERLLKESTAEATKKGFCDEQLGKANQDRDYRMTDANKLDQEIQRLELKEEELTSELAVLADGINASQTALSEAEEIRKAEKVQNLDTIKTARGGLSAVREAINILKVFYKNAAKAVLLQASPVDEDTSGPGFAGAYGGNQEASKGIFGLLEVIESDFDRTIRTTEAAEKKAAAEFVDFDRAMRSDLSSKETKTSLNQEDLATTQDTRQRKTDELTSAQSLLDDALRTLEDLKPTCTDTGMSYAERVAKREEEIAALKRAYCILLPSDGERGTDDNCRQQQGQGLMF